MIPHLDPRELTTKELRYFLTAPDPFEPSDSGLARSLRNAQGVVGPLMLTLIIMNNSNPFNESILV